MSNIYLVKYGTKKFEKETLVKFITCTNSGNCYLVVDLNDDSIGEWVMYYDIYPIVYRSWDYRYYYDEKLDKKGKELLLNYIS